MIGVPSKLYNTFMDCGFIDCFQFQSNEDEFQKLYSGQRLFVNPPYSKLSLVPLWINKNIKRNTIYLLIPSRTDTVYFHELLKFYPHIYFIKGRLHFNDSKSAPFPSLIMVFNPCFNISFWSSVTVDEFTDKLIRDHIDCTRA